MLPFAAVVLSVTFTSMLWLELKFPSKIVVFGLALGEEFTKVVLLGYVKKSVTL